MHESVCQDTYSQTKARLCGTCAFYNNTICRVISVESWSGHSNTSVYLIEYNRANKLVSGKELEYRFENLGNVIYRDRLMWCYYNPERRLYTRGMPLVGMHLRHPLSIRVGSMTVEIYRMFNRGTRTYSAPGFSNEAATAVMWDKDYGAMLREHWSLSYKGITVGQYQHGNFKFDQRIKHYRPDVINKFREYIQ